jgi:aerobic carbon-monoxide dehydrogenase large subunit
LNPGIVGRSLGRLEDVPILVGSGRFVDDVTFPDMLHACFLRSAHAHAFVRKVDCAVASSLEGIRAIYTFADIRRFLRSDRLVVALPSKAYRQQLDRPVLAIDEVVYVGEPIAVAIADTRAQAEDAIGAIGVDYDPLQPVVECAAAVAAGAPKAHRGASHNVAAELDLTFGDIERAFSEAPHVFAQNLRQTRGGSHSIECRGVVSIYDTVEDKLTVWSSTQTPHAAMRLLAEMLGREEKSVRVIAPDVGGGFGPKLVFYQEELVVALAATLFESPGEMDRGSSRAFHLRHARARPSLGSGDCGRSGREHSRHSRLNGP